MRRLPLGPGGEAFHPACAWCACGRDACAAGGAPRKMRKAWKVEAESVICDVRGHDDSRYRWRTGKFRLPCAGTDY